MKARVARVLRWIGAIVIWLNALALTLYLVGAFMPGHDVWSNLLLGAALLTFLSTQAQGGWFVARKHEATDEGKSDDDAALEPLIVPMRSGIAYDTQEFVPARDC